MNLTSPGIRNTIFREVQLVGASEGLNDAPSREEDKWENTYDNDTCTINSAFLRERDERGVLVDLSADVGTLAR